VRKFLDLMEQRLKGRYPGKKRRRSSGEEDRDLPRTSAGDDERESGQAVEEESEISLVCEAEKRNGHT